MRIYHWPLAAVVACTAVSTPTVQAAETYPTRPVRFIIPFEPGGSNDTANFWQPTKIFHEPVANEVYVSDGYGNSRIVRSDPDGAYLGTWGTPGPGARRNSPTCSAPSRWRIISR